jgi:hypothetical protein
MIIAFFFSGPFDFDFELREDREPLEDLELREDVDPSEEGFESVEYDCESTEEDGDGIIY